MIDQKGMQPNATNQLEHGVKLDLHAPHDCLEEVLEKALLFAKEVVGWTRQLDSLEEELNTLVFPSKYECDVESEETGR